MRTALLLALLGTSLSADVAVLKDGGKVSGRIVEKPQHWEITTDAGLRTYLKEEVDRIVKDPKELLGDVDKIIADAKGEYGKAIDMPEGPERNARLKETIARVDVARTATSTTRELFPEDKYAELDQKLMQIMQLKRLLRDRLHSDFAAHPGSAPVARPAPGPSAPLEESFSTLVDPSRRSDIGKRVMARESFRTQRAAHPEIYELATAAMLFLSRTDQEWNLQGASLAALQDYFAQAWLKNPTAMTPDLHQAAAQWVIDRVAALKKADARAPTDAISLFGIGHLGQAPIGAESDKSARLLGLELRNGILGTPEGHAVRDLNSWIAAGDFDLAVLAFTKEYRSTDTPIVRFVWSYALLRLVQDRKRGYERPIAALATITLPDGPAKEHVAALGRSIKGVAVCNVCQGQTKLRCTNCHGKKETKILCKKCNGKGKVPDPGYADLGARGFNVPEIPCYPCRGRGYDLLIKCEKCKDGFVDCKNCDRKPRTPPAMEEICTGDVCQQCDGRGYVFRNVLWACKSCLGLGQKLVPKADPSRVLQ
ncbi:MAG TPA: hypothetical protein VKW04_24440 [Planctomycetota bacterium]|nr:hypothetical protein [Planctomycetota bacterium]